MFEHILVPLDGSPIAEAALEAAAYLAKVTQGKLYLVRVPSGKDSNADFDEITPGEEAEDKACQDYLEALAQPLHDLGLTVRCEVLEPGHPAERILEVVEDDEMDLVILTSHGRSGLSRVLMGSVADTVARKARCPVLIAGRLSNLVGRKKDQLKAGRPE